MIEIIDGAVGRAGCLRAGGLNGQHPQPKRVASIMKCLMMNLGPEMRALVNRCPRFLCSAARASRRDPVSCETRSTGGLRVIAQILGR